MVLGLALRARRFAAITPDRVSYVGPATGGTPGTAFPTEYFVPTIRTHTRNLLLRLITVVECDTLALMLRIMFPEGSHEQLERFLAN